MVRYLQFYKFKRRVKCDNNRHITCIGNSVLNFVSIYGFVCIVNSALHIEGFELRNMFKKTTKSLLQVFVFSYTHAIYY